MKVIQSKLKGRRPKLQEREAPQSAEVVDLMSRLRASLEGKGKSGRASATGRGRKKAGTRKRGHAA